MGKITGTTGGVSPLKQKNKAKKIVLGLGCDRGTAAQTIETAIHKALATATLDAHSVVAAASIDKKSDETGLLQVCEASGWPITFYSAESLSKVDVPNPSKVVMHYVGTPSVGEAAAILCAGGTQKDLLIEKFKYKGNDGKNATVSICLKR